MKDKRFTKKDILNAIALKFGSVESYAESLKTTRSNNKHEFQSLEGTLKLNQAAEGDSLEPGRSTT